MDPAQELLFGEFPRSVGVTTPRSDADLRQFVVNSQGAFDVFLETIEGRRSPYASISKFVPLVDEDDGYVGNKVVLDKAAYDFDTHAKAEKHEPGRWNHHRIDPEEDDDTVIRRMRTDESLAEDILGPVCDDVNKIAKASLEDGIPTVGVFSGFGVHVYQLFQPEVNPGERLHTVTTKYISELDLATADGQATGKPFRILRVPNVVRTYEGETTSLICVPLSGRELVESRPQDLLDLSLSKRPDALSAPGERPEMPLHEDYKGQTNVDAAKMRGTAIDFSESHEEEFRWLLQGLFRMPCVYERAVQPNPHHDIRYQVAAMLFNLGFSPTEAHDIIRRLGWIDYDPDITEKQIQSVWNGTTGERGCKRLMATGLCQRAEDPKDCEAYGWQGGKQLWKQ